MRHCTIWRTPQRFLVAECLIWTLLEKACYLLSVVYIPKGIWIEAFGYVCYLVRRSPSTTFCLKTPFEEWISNSAIFDLKLFNCLTYALVSDGILERLTTIFHEFEFGVNSFWLWFIEPLSLSLLVSRVLKFDKLAILFI